MKRADSWTCKQVDILQRNYKTMSVEELAKLTKRTPHAVQQKMHKLGLKKGYAHIEWTPQMLKLLRDFFPIMFNEALAKWIGVSQRTLIRKARELGIEKQEGFLEKRRDDIVRRASEARKARGDVKGTWFKKGIRSNPAGEFKKGHVESPETKAKRSAALKATWAYKKKMKRLGIS